MSNDLTKIPVPGASAPLMGAEVDGKRYAALRPIVEYFGLDYSGQLQKLKGKSWATVEIISTVGADGKAREMAGVDGRTLRTWLVTLDENRVADDRRADLIAYQAEAADALDRHFSGEIDGRTRAGLLTRGDLARMVLEAEEEQKVLAAALETAAPMIEYHDRYISNDDAVIVKMWGAQYGLTQPQAFDLLMDRKVIHRVHIGKRYSQSKGRLIEEYEYRAYAQYVHWFDPRPQHDAPRHHNGQLRLTLYVRQEFALQLAAKLGLTNRIGGQP